LTFFLFVVLGFELSLMLARQVFYQLESLHQPAANVLLLNYTSHVLSFYGIKSNKLLKTENVRLRVWL
jgi:hypothetical protein